MSELENAWRRLLPKAPQDLKMIPGGIVDLGFSGPIPNNFDPSVDYRSAEQRELDRLKALDSTGIADAMVPILQFAAGGSLPGRLALTAAQVAGAPRDQKLGAALEGVGMSVLPNLFGKQVRGWLEKTPSTSLAKSNSMIEMFQDPATGEWSVTPSVKAGQTTSSQPIAAIPEFTSFKPQLSLKVPEIHDLVNARNTVYHATSLDGFKGILNAGGILPNPFLHQGKGYGAFKKWASKQGEITTGKPKPWVVDTEVPSSVNPSFDDWMETQGFQKIQDTDGNYWFEDGNGRIVNEFVKLRRQYKEEFPEISPTKTFETRADAEQFAKRVGGQVRFDQGEVERSKNHGWVQTPEGYVHPGIPDVKIVVNPKTGLATATTALARGETLTQEFPSISKAIQELNEDWKAILEETSYMTDSEAMGTPTWSKNPDAGVSVSRISRIAPKAEKAISFVIDRSKMPRNRGVAELGYRKTEPLDAPDVNWSQKAKMVLSPEEHQEYIQLSDELNTSPGNQKGIVNQLYGYNDSITWAQDHAPELFKKWQNTIEQLSAVGSQQHQLAVTELNHAWDAWTVDMINKALSSGWTSEYAALGAKLQEWQDKLDKLNAYDSKIEFSPITRNVPMNKRFEFEDRTYNTPIPLTAVKGVVVDRSALGQERYTAGKSNSWAAQNALDSLTDYGWDKAIPSDFYNGSWWNYMADIPEIQQWLTKWDFTADKYRDAVDYTKPMEELKTILTKLAKTGSSDTRLDQIRALAAKHGLSVKVEESGRKMHGYRGRLQRDAKSGAPLFGLGAAAASQWLKTKSEDK